MLFCLKISFPNVNCKFLAVQKRDLWNEDTNSPNAQALTLHHWVHQLPQSFHQLGCRYPSKVLPCSRLNYHDPRHFRQSQQSVLPRLVRNVDRALLQQSLRQLLRMIANCTWCPRKNVPERWNYYVPEKKFRKIKGADKSISLKAWRVAFKACWCG